MKQSIFLIVAFATAAWGSVIPRNLPNPQQIAPLMKYLGAIDGKLYFADNEPRTWEEAKTFCQDQGLQLAVINSTEQERGLWYAYNTTNAEFDGYYWTSGRDQHKLDQVVWDATKTPVSSEVEWIFRIPRIEYQTCLYFQVLISHTNLSLKLCTDTLGSLCEALIDTS